TGKAGGGSSPVISGNGRYVAFISHAADSTFDDGSPNPDAFVHGIHFAPVAGGNGTQAYVRDLQTHTIRLATLRPDGRGGFGGVSDLTINDQDDSPSFNGIAVAFVYSSDDLSTLDHNGKDDVYIHGLTGDQNILVSRTPAGTSGNARSYRPVIASDASRVSFLSDATDLTPLSDNNHSPDLFSYEPVTDRVVLVDASSNGGFAASAHLEHYRQDAFGRRFVFQSPSNELIPGVGTPDGGWVNLFLRDITASGGLTLISNPLDARPGTPPGGGDGFADVVVDYHDSGAG